MLQGAAQIYHRNMMKYEHCSSFKRSMEVQAKDSVGGSVQTLPHPQLGLAGWGLAGDIRVEAVWGLHFEGVWLRSWQMHRDLAQPKLVL